MSSAFKEVKLGLKPKLGQQYSRNTAVITITAINSSNKYFEEYFPYSDGFAVSTWSQAGSSLNPKQIKKGISEPEESSKGLPDFWTVTVTAAKHRISLFRQR